MKTFPTFKIEHNGIISEAFLKRNIATFYDACLYIAQLPYGRNENKNVLINVFTDYCGTCSTKHALLKSLAAENNFHAIKLMVGLFKMNAKNTPESETLLLKNKLDYIPEAHCYLKFENKLFDFTKKHPFLSDFNTFLIEEIEIEPPQISDYKVNYHKNYLSKWLNQHPEIPYTLIEIWAIREQCIEALSNK